MRITISLKGREAEVIEMIAKSSGKRNGDVVSEMVHELLEGIMPAFEAQSEAQAMRIVLRAGLNKLAGLLDEPIG